MSTQSLHTGAAYIRVSTDKQEELSPNAQKRLILDYAKKNNIIISSSDIYMENGISGRTASKRPAFQEMIAKAKSKDHPYDLIRSRHEQKKNSSSLLYPLLLLLPTFHSVIKNV